MANHMALQEGFLKILFEDTSHECNCKRTLPFAKSELYQSKVINAIKLTKGEDVKDIYDITLDREQISYNFDPGDTIAILPNNNPEEVKKLFLHLDCINVVDKNCRIVITDEKKKRTISHIPEYTTLWSIFSKYVDIRSPPKKAFLKVLAQYAENEDERAALAKLYTPSSQDYTSFITTTGRSLISLLQTFPSCKISVERIIENLSPLQPRPYTISSSPLLKNEMHVTFSVEYFDNNIKGVCTGWLENIITPIIKNTKIVQSEQNNSVSFYFRKSNSFQLNIDTSWPIIMIGPGTGIAPFIGFLQHLSLKKKILDTWLFYGCRYKYRDYLYRNMLQKYVDENYLRKLSTAFSREQCEKMYVQDLIIKEATEMYHKLVKENALVYVCGDIKDMMKHVKEAIKLCLISNGMTIDEAELFIANMVKTHKYVEDKWI